MLQPLCYFDHKNEVTQFVLHKSYLYYNNNFINKCRDETGNYGLNDCQALIYYTLNMKNINTVLYYWHNY